jgi:hypothetical protein
VNLEKQGGAADRRSHEEWAKLLCERFFRPEYAHSHVMFYVDRQVLAELDGSSTQAAVESLALATASRLRPMAPRQLFEPIGALTRRWRAGGGEGPPPCLPTLALAVLAATDMRHDQNRASNNYYAWFYDLLRLGGVQIEDTDAYHAYGEEVPALWGHLKWWLDLANRGSLGLSTIVEDEHWTRLGFADSQTLFRSSDREKLTQYLSWLDMRPGESLPERELIEYFRIWSSRREDLSLGTWAMLEEDDLPRQLVDLLSSAASSWQGVERDDTGRTLGQLLISLKPPPNPQFRIAASRPEGFPKELEVATPDGTRFVLRCQDPVGSGAESWYQGLSLEVTSAVLEKGFELSAREERAFKLSPREIYVLQRNDSLGRWASVEAIRPGEEAWLLVADRVVDALGEFLEARARGEWKRVGATVAPRGWALLRGVVIDPIDAPVDGRFRSLAPRRGNRLLLDGGLPMPHGHRVYLVGGPPDVQLPALVEELQGAELSVDGLPRPNEGAQTIRLADAPLDEGGHEVALGAIRIRFGLIESEGRVIPEVPAAICHRIEVSRASASGASDGASLQAAPAAPPDGSEVEVEGADIRGAVPGGSRQPVILPTGASRRVLLGRSPGEIEEVECPTRPRWMDGAGLGFRVFEHFPNFSVAWVLTDGFRGKRVRAAQGAGPVTDGPELVGARATVAAWRSAVREAALVAGESGGDADLASLLELAEGLGDG